MSGRCCLAMAALALLAGCDKQVNVTFVNYTRRPLPLEVRQPGRDQEFVGLIPARRGAVRARVSARRELLPAQVRWVAGGRKGTFALREDTPADLRIDVGPAREPVPYPWKGRIKDGRIVPDGRDDDGG